jgi:hypothetical protein
MHIEGPQKGMPYIRDDLFCHCGPLAVGAPTHSLSSLRGAHTATCVTTTAICRHTAKRPEQGEEDSATATSAGKLGRRSGSPLLQE